MRNRVLMFTGHRLRPKVVLRCAYYIPFACEHPCVGLTFLRRFNGYVGMPTPLRLRFFMSWIPLTRMGVGTNVRGLPRVRIGLAGETSDERLERIRGMGDVWDFLEPFRAP